MWLWIKRNMTRKHNSNVPMNARVVGVHGRYILPYDKYDHPSFGKINRVMEGAIPIRQTVPIRWGEIVPSRVERHLGGLPHLPRLIVRLVLKLGDGIADNVVNVGSGELAAVGTLRRMSCVWS